MVSSQLKDSKVKKIVERNVKIVLTEKNIFTHIFWFGMSSNSASDEQEVKQTNAIIPQSNLVFVFILCHMLHCADLHRRGRHLPLGVDVVVVPLRTFFKKSLQGLSLISFLNNTCIIFCFKFLEEFFRLLRRVEMLL